MDEEILKLLKEKIKNLGSISGCYLWKNIQEEVIYVGKAVRLSERVRSYLNPNIQDLKTQSLQKEIHDFEFIATNTEIEALILEDNLIKKYNPKYNIRLKDDKSYPFICVSTDEDYPMVYLTRKVKLDKKKYFGPYTDVRAARQLLNSIHKIFPIRKTKQNLPLSKPRRPCLNFYIKRCLAPCQGNILVEDYEIIVEQILKFLDGKKDILLNELKLRMQTHSERMDFERATIYRDMIENIQSIQRRQTIVNKIGGDEDIIGFAKNSDEGQVVILEVRDGRLDGKKSFAFSGVENSNDEEFIFSFLRIYYLRANFIPNTILLPKNIHQDVETLKEAISTKVGFQPKFISPKLGDKKSLLNLANKNAEMNLTERILATKLKDQTEALKDLKRILNLKEIPAIIECYDISHFQGSEPVASGVIFIDGKPYKSGYRKYIMKSYKGINDPGMMHEVISRRLQRILNEEEALPNLIVIDGGLTQLGRATEAAVALELNELPMIGLAKKREEIYFPGESSPYQFDINSPAIRLLRQIRDEAHRFGVSFHRTRRNKKTMRTVLDGIPEVGLARRKSIIKFLDGKKKIQSISFMELKSISGIGDKIALKIFENLKKLNSNEA
jgi:excinuclease ABC subunit C